jgi:tetratricopeptide (TPR) repeat protein
MTAKQSNGLENGSKRVGAMDGLYARLVTWLYERQDVRRAQSVANRLERLLARFPPKPQNIFIEECRSLVAEAKGDLKSAIKHRLNEIGLIRRLHELARGPDAGHAAALFRQYSYADLRDRYIILAMLHHDTGELDKAIKALRKAKPICKRHGIPFDSEDLLKDYLNERKVTASPRTRPASGSHDSSAGRVRKTESGGRESAL